MPWDRGADRSAALVADCQEILQVATIDDSPADASALAPLALAKLKEGLDRSAESA